MNASAVFLLLLVLACPLMMMWMMRGGHGHGHGGSGHSGHDHDDAAPPEQTAEVLMEQVAGGARDDQGAGLGLGGGLPHALSLPLAVALARGP